MASKTSVKEFDILPHTCVFIDADLKHLLQGAYKCLFGKVDRPKVITELKRKFITKTNPNPALPCLSVRSGFDLFLQVKNYPPGSQIILSAINIPDMVAVLKHHKLKPVPFDVSIDNMAPKVDMIDQLVNEKTVAILVAHVYGKWFDMEPLILAAEKHNLDVIEDCAEVFCGFERLGHTKSDVSLFSFGVIKFSTAFGGAIAKVKDKHIYDQMEKLNAAYPTQPHKEYLKKLLKCLVAFTFLDCPKIIKPSMYLTRLFNIDHKKKVVELLRGFPTNLMQKLRFQPCDSLLQLLLDRLQEFDASSITLGKVKGDYVTERLPDKVTVVGQRAHVNNYWLFPILVDNPDQVLKTLNALGVDAYRGATQLNMVEPENGNTPLAFLHRYLDTYPHEAKYLFDHVIYLPVNKMVPFHDLEQICAAVDIAVSRNDESPVGLRRQSVFGKVKVTSKL